jgi:ABC-type sulfate transport system permease component
MSSDVLERPWLEKISFSWLSRANSALLWVLVFALVLYPLLMVLAAAFTPSFPDSEPLKIFDLLTDRLITAAGNTLRLGFSVSLLSLITGSALALLAAHSRRESWVDLLMSIPFLTPPFVVSLAWSLAVGPKGYLGRAGLFGREAEQLIFSFWGLSLVMAAHYAPMVYFAVRSQVDKISSSLLWAGRIAGATPRIVIGRILFPLTFPALMAGSFLAFACAIEEYGTPLVIGNRIGFPVIATEIARVVRLSDQSHSRERLGIHSFYVGRVDLLRKPFVAAPCENDIENKQLPCAGPALSGSTCWIVGIRRALCCFHLGHPVRRHAAHVAAETRERWSSVEQFDAGELPPRADARFERSPGRIVYKPFPRIVGSALRNVAWRSVCSRRCRAHEHGSRACRYTGHNHGSGFYSWLECALDGLAAALR